MRNLDSCRRWRCMLCPCNVRHKFFIHFWNRTILLCMPCTFIYESNNAEVVMCKVPVILVGSLGGSDKCLWCGSWLSVARKLSLSHCSAAIITLWIRRASSIKRGVKVRSGTVQAFRIWQLFWKSASGTIEAKSLYSRGRRICSGRINGRK
jgi:hypothetical protein